MGNHHVVLGVEGDIDWSGIDGTTTVPVRRVARRALLLATVRGCLGYAWDRFLPYVTGGLAVGDINAKIPGLPAGSITNAGGRWSGRRGRNCQQCQHRRNISSLTSPISIAVKLGPAAERQRFYPICSGWLERPI
jgi:hypothetical protein